MEDGRGDKPGATGKTQHFNFVLRLLLLAGKFKHHIGAWRWKLWEAYVTFELCRSATGRRVIQLFVLPIPGLQSAPLTVTRR